MMAEVNALSMTLRSVEDLKKTSNELIVFLLVNISIKMDLKWHNIVIYITIKILCSVLKYIEWSNKFAIYLIQLIS